MAMKELSRLLARRRWSESEGRAAITAWRRSGLTIAAFARREDLDVQRLRRWRRRGSEEKDVALVPVDIVTRSAAALEVVVGAVVIRVPPEFDEATLRRVLEVVTTC